MKTSGISLGSGPLRSRPRRTFIKQELLGLSHADQSLFEQFGQGPLVSVGYEMIHHAFEDHAARQPQAIAAEHEGASITYGDLELQSEKLAHRLVAMGVKPGDKVGIFLQRSIPMLVGILGTLKAGASYVPQDVRIAPKPQLEHVMAITEMRVVLTISTLAAMVPEAPGVDVVAIDELMAGPAPKERVPRRTDESGDDVCFVLFTSGTTGKPNGVQVTHRNLCNILLTEPGDLGMRPGLKVSQILNIAFDMAAWEILGALAHGATLVIRGKNIQEAASQVDIIIATPSILSMVDRSKSPRVKTVAVAGEPCPRPLADDWATQVTFYNCCGPTEVTIVNTMQHYLSSSALLTIGKPTPNNTVYVLNEELKPCAIGEIGEIWAGGDCVSKGYLGNEALNEERYRPDPFLGGGRLMFRTRDLGRWTGEGELEHFGRTDDQVKIRGFRVELDSVSTALETVPGCLQAVSLKLDSRSLVSFVRPASVDIEAAYKAIADRLPYYCMPSMILAVDEFPVTSRGKIDKRELTIQAVKAQEKEALKEAAV